MALIANNSRPWARCGRRTSRTYLLRSWAVRLLEARPASRGTSLRGKTRKEWSGEYSIEQRVDRAPCDPDHPASVLVDPPRTDGVPIDLFGPGRHRCGDRARLRVRAGGLAAYRSQRHGPQS